MEPLWSPVVATGGNRWQIGSEQTRLKQARTVAVGCDRLRATFHGKEGVDGSSPSEGFEKQLQIGGFFTHGVVHVAGVEVDDAHMVAHRIEATDLGEVRRLAHQTGVTRGRPPVLDEVTTAAMRLILSGES
jgi:hypothetical protein